LKREETGLKSWSTKKDETEMRERKEVKNWLNAGIGKISSKAFLSAYG
jgi:hypothetical protein